MFTKLHALYRNSRLQHEKPDLFFFPDYYWFTDKEESEWFGVPAKDMTDEELRLLRTLFQSAELPGQLDQRSKGWHDWLFHNGSLPNMPEERCKMAQIELSGSEFEQEDAETALRAFLSVDIVLLWEKKTRCYLVIPEGSNVGEDEFRSIIQAFETDFYVKMYVYLGKFFPAGDQLRAGFEKEKDFFDRALRLMPHERVLSFEKAFPSCLVAEMKPSLRDSLDTQLLGSAAEDSELLATIKAFLENGSNATLTAKKLYIHRNTLQYRLDKFSEKTGVNLKDFNNAVTVYLACLLNDQQL
jgi:DNA-binding PucR family transcriptional regulator